MDGITKELQDELREKIGELRYGASKDRENEVSANQRQRRIDAFMIEMSGRLTEQRDAVTREARDRIDQATPAPTPDRSLASERDRSLMVHVDGKEAERNIRDRIDTLRDGMIKAAFAIEKNREPDLAFLDEPQREREKSEPQLEKQRSGPTPERVAEIKAEIARKREKHKSKDREPDR